MGLASLLRNVIVRNFAGLNSSELYSKSILGTKTQIKEFYELLKKSLLFIKKANNFPNKKKFFKELEHSYGRSALCLSGGAIFGLSHLGVLSVLLENNLLPKVISGSSSGSLITTLIGCNSKDELKILAEKNYK